MINDSHQFQVNCLFGTGEETKQNQKKKKDFRWPPWRPSSISDRNDSTYFWCTSHLEPFYQVRDIALSIQEKQKDLNFQDGHIGDHLGFPIGKTFSYFVTYKSLRCFIPSFESTDLFVQDKNWNRWRPWGPFWIFDRNNLDILHLQATAMLHTKFPVYWPWVVGGLLKQLLTPHTQMIRRTTNIDSPQ